MEVDLGMCRCHSSCEKGIICNRKETYKLTRVLQGSVWEYISVLLSSEESNAIYKETN